MVELHTGAYAEAQDEATAGRADAHPRGGGRGLRHGLRVNAGHGLHYGNVGPVAAVDGIAELNIGHAIVAQAVFDGWEKAVRDMKALMVQARLEALRGR